jgi:hypothetical protein
MQLTRLVSDITLILPMASGRKVVRKSGICPTPQGGEGIHQVWWWKVNLTLHCVMEVYGGSGWIDACFLDLNTIWKLVVTLMPLPHYLREKTPGAHWIGGWMDPRVIVDCTVKWEFLTLLRPEMCFLGCPAHSQSLYRTKIKYFFFFYSVFEYRDPQFIGRSMKMLIKLLKFK